ncbi:hypothetical protein BKA70DRAFT_1144260 [Coprinopsis sp. MPI-PUGE-AT-0042]|nr:hypothetical protein BKA70DRAFT_1144260 [Coprinopsis sp. MPI-PUGE-AT-0042]
MSTPEETSAQLIYPPSLLHNASLQNIKFLSSCFAGAAAGILGLTNLLGFAWFLLCSLLMTGVVTMVNCRGKPKKYLMGGLWELVNPGQDNASTFLLVWTLFYGIVHVYD